MHCTKNIIIEGALQKPISIDIFFINDHKPKPVVIYAHGFNGFKDWGNFDLIAKIIAEESFVLVKFNFSHNGTTPKNPEEFTDLEAFGNNNYSIELKDLSLVIDWVCDPMNIFHQAINSGQIFLIGHSMGGGIAILQAARDKRVKALITWSAISECKTPWGSWSFEKMEEWKRTGVQYYPNSRTKQQMPMFYQLYEDYIKNRDMLDIEKAIKAIDIPILICHGTLDNAVLIETAFKLQQWQPAAKLFTVESDHVYGRSHPWAQNFLPPAMEKVLRASMDFLINQINNPYLISDPIKSN